WLIEMQTKHRNNMMDSRTIVNAKAYTLFFGVFIFLNCIFYRDFSYLSIAENIYITEVFIGLSLSVLMVNLLGNIKEKRLNIKKTIALWGAFLLWGTLLLLTDNNSSIFF